MLGGGTCPRASEGGKASVVLLKRSRHFIKEGVRKAAHLVRTTEERGVAQRRLTRFSFTGRRLDQGVHCVDRHQSMLPQRIHRKAMRSLPSAPQRVYLVANGADHEQGQQDHLSSNGLAAQWCFRNGHAALCRTLGRHVRSRFVS